MIQPTAWQQRVMEIPERYNLALLGGRGGGKTTLMLLLALRHIVEHGEGAKVLLVRRTYKSLAEIEERLVDLFARAWPNDRISFNRQEKVFRLPNGATCELGQLDAPSDHSKFIGREATLLLVDEITQYTTLRHVRLLRANLRSPTGIPCRTVYAGNPGGPSAPEIARLHVSSRRPWEPYELEEGDLFVTCPSTIADNDHVETGPYVTQLRAACGGDRAQLAAWLENDWDALTGAFFGSQWGPHLILPETDEWLPPKGKGSGYYTGWGFDWGVSSPGVALGFASPREHGIPGPGGKRYPKGSRIVLCEVHSAAPDDPNRGLEWPISVWIDELKAASQEFNLRQQGVADDARGLGLDESVIGELRKAGLIFSKFDKRSRVAGWAKVKAMMRAAEIQDPDEPWLVFHPRCMYALETIPALPRDPRRIEDADTSANDHAADALRGIAMMNTGPQVRSSFDAFI